RVRSIEASWRRLSKRSSCSAPQHRSGLAYLHDHLDRIFDALASIADRGRHLGERKRMRVYQLGIEALLRHQRSGAVRRALTLATNPEHVDVVAHKIGEIDGHRILR